MQSLSRVKVVGLGDSTTAGTPAFMSPVESPPDGRGNPESQWAYWMKKAHPDWEVFNRGVNGERTDQILKRFDRDVLQLRPDYVVVLGGVNDVYQGLPVESAEANLEATYGRAVSARIVPVAATVLPFDTMSQQQAESIHQINRWVRETAQKRSLPFCDTSAVVSSPGKPDLLAGSPDGLHPDVAGYRKMGEALSQAIAAHLRT